MYSSTVSQVLKLVSSELDPYIQEKLNPHLDGLHWINILQQLDIARGKTIDSWEYKASDLSMQLRMLTERLGNLGYPFDSQDRNRTCSSYGSVLRLIRNRWAHNDNFQAFDCLQAIEISYALLTHIGAVKAASDISDIRTELLRSVDSSSTNGSDRRDPKPETTPATSLIPHQPKPTKGNGGTNTIPQRPTPNGSNSSTISYENEYEEWSQIIVGEQSELDSMRSSRTREIVRSIIEDIVEVEGPVSPIRVQRLVGHAFGFARLSKTRISQIARQFQGSQVHQDEHGFLWPQNISPAQWPVHRTIGPRDFLEVSPHELRNALSHLLESKNSQQTTSEIRKELLALYGRQRETAEVKKHLNTVFKLQNS